MGCSLCSKVECVEGVIAYNPTNCHHCHEVKDRRYVGEHQTTDAYKRPSENRILVQGLQRVFAAKSVTKHNADHREKRV